MTWWMAIIIYAIAIALFILLMLWMNKKIEDKDNKKWNQNFIFNTGTNTEM